MSEVKGHVRQSETGDIEHVVEVEGANLVIASIPADLIASRVENAQNRGDVVKGSSANGPKGVASMNVAELDEYAEGAEIDDYPAEGTKAEKRAAIEAAAQYGEA